MVITAQMSGCLRKGAIISSDNCEVREKPRGFFRVVALYQGRGLYSGEELEGCLSERYRVERERE